MRNQSEKTGPPQEQIIQHIVALRKQAEEDPSKAEFLRNVAKQLQQFHNIPDEKINIEIIKSDFE